MKKIVVMLDKFGHDTNGCPVARHTVFSYASEDQALDAPTEELYQTRTRQQVGYTTDRKEWAGTALRRAKIESARFVRREGDRSSGTIWLIYSA